LQILRHHDFLLISDDLSEIGHPSFCHRAFIGKGDDAAGLAQIRHALMSNNIDGLSIADTFLQQQKSPIAFTIGASRNVPPKNGHEAGEAV
jgi:hypothetical protein